MGSLRCDVLRVLAFIAWQAQFSGADDRSPSRLHFAGIVMCQMLGSFLKVRVAAHKEIPSRRNFAGTPSLNVVYPASKPKAFGV